MEFRFALLHDRLVVFPYFLAWEVWGLGDALILGFNLKSGQK